MTKPLHPRVLGPDGKLVRHRRTRAEIEHARVVGAANAELDAMTAPLEAALARATPAQIKQAQRTLAYWKRQEARY